MEIASHNTMTYLEPYHWYMKPFNFIAKCQSLTLQEQWDLGIRVFDLRIGFDNFLNPYFCHGLMKYNMCPYKVFLDLNAHNEKCYVRIILENSKKDLEKFPLKETAFIKLCSDIQEVCKNIQFFGGIRKYDWAKLYNFKFDIDKKDEYSSNNSKGNLWLSWFPWLYAKLHNKETIYNNIDSDKIIFMDFVK
jgi:hypothetical protein